MESSLHLWWIEVYGQSVLHLPEAFVRLSEERLCKYAVYNINQGQNNLFRSVYFLYVCKTFETPPIMKLKSKIPTQDRISPNWLSGSPDSWYLSFSGEPELTLPGCRINDESVTETFIRGPGQVVRIWSASDWHFVRNAQEQIVPSMLPSCLFCITFCITWQQWLRERVLALLKS